MAEALSRTTILRDYHAAARRGRPYTWFNYQPISLPGYESTLALAGRRCFDRLQAILRQIHSFFPARPLRVIDWGCNLGFFAFELSRLGHEVVGVDCDRRLVEICRYLAETNDFEVRPQFFCDRIDESTIPKYGQFDVAICLSVLHHLRDNRRTTLKRFAEQYPCAFIELDGRDFGLHELSSYYWRLSDIVECNDRYGSGTRCRRTWFCANRDGTSQFQSLKSRNVVGGRGVFRKQQTNRTTVVKREAVHSSHTWIKTDLRHELAMYQACSQSRFFAQLLGHGHDQQFRWIECEYIESDATGNRDELREFFQFLEENRLFILDLSRDAFLFSRGRLKLVDLESLFPLAGTVSELVQRHTSLPSIRLDTYQKQFEYIAQSLNS